VASRRGPPGRAGRVTGELSASPRPRPGRTRARGCRRNGACRRPHPRRPAAPGAPPGAAVATTGRSRR